MNAGRVNLAGRIRATRHPKRDAVRNLTALAVMIFAGIGFWNTLMWAGRLLMGTGR